MSSDPQTDRSWIALDRAALRHNLAVARRWAGPGGGVMAVVKADAYGLGVRLVVPELDRAGADCFAVATLAEGRELREVGVTRPIYLLSPAAPAERRAVVEAGDAFIPAVSGIEEAAGFSELALAAGRRQAVHLVVDTGMGRIGMLESEAVELSVRVAAMPGLVIDSVASHFPSADEDPGFTAAQLARHHALLDALAAAGLDSGRHHVANSAGAISQPRRGRELIRTGLMLYGVPPFAGRQDDLRAAVAWHARVVLARTLPAGHGVSYGRTFITAAPTRVATLPVGYADGYPRHLSGRGAWVRLGGVACPVLGRVTMDQIVIAAPEDVKAGDIATLMGGDGPSPAELAERAGTIAHDIFCGLGGRLGRLVV